MLTAQCDEEYRAWHAVVAEFQKLGMDVDSPKHKRLIKAICVWGERLHALRADQTPVQVKAALAMYLDQYETAKE